MYFLHIIFAILCLLALAGTFTDLKYKKACGILFWLLVLIFFALSFLRWERGPDWEQYYSFFTENTPPNPGLSLEMGYQYLSYWIGNTTGEYSLLLFVQGAILSFCTGWIIWRYSKSPLLSFLVFFAISFAGIYFVRQYVAVALTMFSFGYVVQRRFWPFAFFVFLASQFHITAWIFLLAYPIYSMQLSTRKILILLALSFVCSILLMQTLLALLGSMGGFVAAKINMYLELGSDPSSTGAGGSLFLLLLKGFAQRGFIFLSIILLLNNGRKTDPVLNGMINFYVFSIILFAATAPLSIVLARIVNYYEYYIILLIPAIVSQPYLRFNQFIICLVMIFYCYIRFTSSYNQYPKRFAPYKSIFDKEAPIYME